MTLSAPTAMLDASALTPTKGKRMATPCGHMPEEHDTLIRDIYRDGRDQLADLVRGLLAEHQDTPRAVQAIIIGMTGPMMVDSETFHALDDVSRVLPPESRAVVVRIASSAYTVLGLRPEQAAAILHELGWSIPAFMIATDMACERDTQIGPRVNGRLCGALRTDEVTVLIDVAARTLKALGFAPERLADILDATVAPPPPTDPVPE